jgi:hypothetical protein
MDEVRECDCALSAEGVRPKLMGDEKHVSGERSFVKS